MKGWKQAVTIGLCLVALLSNLPNAGAGAVKKPLTLQQAVEIGMKRAVDWNPKAKLANAMSVDFPMERESGEEGKRRLWHEEFGVPGTTDHLRLTVEDGEIKAVRETKGKDQDIDSLGDIDSPEALKRAKTDAKLRPGGGVSVGYHYRLETDDEKRSRLAVLGSDAKGRPLRVHFQLADKRQITVYRKDIAGGGLYVGDKPLLGAKGDKHWSIYGIELAPDEKQTMLVWGYPNPAEQLKQFAKLSRDHGGHWEDIHSPGLVRRYWWQGSVQLYAHDEAAVWRSNDFGQTWETVWAGKPTHKLNSADTHEQQVVLVTDQGLQLSNDEGRSWNGIEVPGGAQQAAYDADGTLYVQTNKGIVRQRAGAWEKVPAKFLQKNNGRVICAKEQEFSLPTPDGWKTYLYPDNSLYAERIWYSPDRLYVLTKNKLYSRSPEPDAVWTQHPLPDVGLLLDLAVVPQNELYFAFSPRLVWQEQKSKP